MRFPRFRVSVERREYLKRKKELRGTENMPAVEVKNLVKKYGSMDAVKGISFSINEGEIFGLIGPNGAGKTTTLRVLSTLLSINGGSVTILGHDLSKHAAEIRKLISYLPEDAGAYKNVDTYSKGMMRRLLVGRALMTNPKLAILDEPTSGLDVINAQEIRKLVKSTAQSGTTVLLSSHNMLEVEYLCDRIALISEGKIVEEGKPKTLMEKYKARNIEEVFIRTVHE
jgi:ABC-2 type transport system ATP-binding protein